MYVTRHLTQAVYRLAKQFGAVLVVGARQTGKTTLLQNAFPTLTYLTMDDPAVMTLARNEPSGFFTIWQPPVVLDEIQYAPDLFVQMKLHIDRHKGRGMSFLSGSQQFHMMQHITESMAGRVGIVQLHGLSLREEYGSTHRGPFVPYPEAAQNVAAPMEPLGYDALWARIHRGSMPALAVEPDADWQSFFAAYVRTYLQRDVADLSQVGDSGQFFRFMTACAAMTGQILNMSSLARDTGVSQPTAQRWLGLLQASNIVYLLQPYHNNLLKRLVKRPKLYFLDTGLAAYLTGWSTPLVLARGAMAGAFFESFVLAEILKSYANAGIADPHLYYFRDKEQIEIDLLIEKDGVLYPVEMKKHVDPTGADIRAFGRLDNLPGVDRGPGCVVCPIARPAPLTARDCALPVEYI